MSKSKQKQSSLTIETKMMEGMEEQNNRANGFMTVWQFVQNSEWRVEHGISNELFYLNNYLWN